MCLRVWCVSGNALLFATSQCLRSCRRCRCSRPCTRPAGASHFTAHASALGPAHGLATLASAPVLSELQAFSDWDSLYAPRLGPLPAFLAQHQQQLGFRVLEVPGGGLLKLPPSPAGAGSKLDLQQLRTGLKLAVEQVRGGGCRVTVAALSKARSRQGWCLSNESVDGSQAHVAI